ncbi:MAG: 4-hydroxy-tetrahydrodipicolinate synthase [Bacteroidaceae bacterium]|nr:4-hydroxy-tetrahydrodipicolinate synthase [Bacteroidaceae bacterium]
MYKDMHGLGVALVTPFKGDGSVDYEALARLVDTQLACGTDFLCVLGTTAETPTLTAEEQRQVCRTIMERNAGRLPILLGVGGNCTQAIVDRLSNDAMEGVDAILSVVPYYNKPTQAGMYAHFAAIAESTDLPVILYNVPGRTGVNMLPETTLRLAADFKNIVGIKEASGNLEQIEQIISNRPAGFKVFSGDDGITLPLIRSGADGVISVIGNAFAPEFAQLVHDAMRGDYAEAEAMDERLRQMYELLFLDGNPAGVKAVLHLRGMMENRLRLPLVPASDTTTEQIRNFLAAF